MSFRLAPRTVWGTRRWFLGRETETYTLNVHESVKRYGMIQGPFPKASTPAGITSQSQLRWEHTEKAYKKALLAGEATEERETKLTKWSSRVYYANQFARTIWWYAQETGALDIIDPGLAAGFRMVMGVSTHAMGLIATSGAVIGGVSTGQYWMAAAAALSLPIQMYNMMSGITESFKDEELRQYFDRRDKRLADHMYGDA